MKEAEGDNTPRQMAGQLVIKSFSSSCFGVLSFEDGWALAADSPGVGVAGKMKGGCIHCLPCLVYSHMIYFPGYPETW